MHLYRYIPIENLWRLLEIVLLNRLHCATWDQLNDPLEGRFELSFAGKRPEDHGRIVEHLESDRNTWRVSSLSKDPSHFLLWSHYANGHKGVAVEIWFEPTNTDVTEIRYTPFSSIFGEDTDLKSTHRHMFEGKTPEWKYEAEWRVITKQKYYPLDAPVKRILLGPKVEPERVKMLRDVLPPSIELVCTDININTSRVEETGKVL
jgi:Protein of unknown function (DUF2971)